MIVKICGICSLDDARAAADAGADLLGLNFFARSPRFITPTHARELATQFRADLGERAPLLIGLFVNETVGHMQGVLRDVGLDAAQLSGDEPPELVREMAGRAYKSIRPRDITEAESLADQFLPYAPTDPRLPALLVDAYNPHLYGGTGETAPVEVAVALRARTSRMMLAGGLTPENVAERAAACGAWGVDVASGVEADGQPGVKDGDKVRAFVAAAKGNA